jgi:hypothetical protein
LRHVFLALKTFVSLSIQTKREALIPVMSNHLPRDLIHAVELHFKGYLNHWMAEKNESFVFDQNLITVILDFSKHSNGHFQFSTLNIVLTITIY